MSDFPSILSLLKTSGGVHRFIISKIYVVCGGGGLLQQFLFRLLLLFFQTPCIPLKVVSPPFQEQFFVRLDHKNKKFLSTKRRSLNTPVGDQKSVEHCFIVCFSSLGMFLSRCKRLQWVRHQWMSLPWTQLQDQHPRLSLSSPRCAPPFPFDPNLRYSKSPKAILCAWFSLLGSMHTALVCFHPPPLCPRSEPDGHRGRFRGGDIHRRRTCKPGPERGRPGAHISYKESISTSFQM